MIPLYFSNLKKIMSLSFSGFHFIIEYHYTCDNHFEKQDGCPKTFYVGTSGKNIPKYIGIDTKIMFLSVLEVKLSTLVFSRVAILKNKMADPLGPFL